MENLWENEHWKCPISAAEVDVENGYPASTCVEIGPPQMSSSAQGSQLKSAIFVLWWFSSLPGCGLENLAPKMLFIFILYQFNLFISAQDAILSFRHHPNPAHKCCSSIKML